MSYRTVGLVAYGFQTIVASATSVILTAGLVTSDAILAGTRPYATFFDVGNDVALGLVALTWLAMGIYEKKEYIFRGWTRCPCFDNRG